MNNSNLYRWVKASERLPETSEKMCLKISGRMVTYHDGYFYVPTKTFHRYDELNEPHEFIDAMHNIEWLEPLPTETKEVKESAEPVFDRITENGRWKMTRERFKEAFDKYQSVPVSEWIMVEDRLPTEADTNEESYNEVQTLQIGNWRISLMKYWEVKNCPFTKFWLPIPTYPAKPWYKINPLEIQK